MDDRDLIERAQIRRVVQTMYDDALRVLQKDTNFMLREDARSAVGALAALLDAIDARPAGIAP